MAAKVHGISPVNLPQRFPLPDKRQTGCPEFLLFSDFPPRRRMGAVLKKSSQESTLNTLLNIMRTQAPLKMQGIRLRRPRFAALAVIVLFLSFMAGCGGSKSANNTVAVV